MCGIFVYKGSSIPDDVLVKSASMIKHRGPDLTTYQKIDDVFLAFHRLSIIDLSYDGNQPFVDANNRNFIVCNGEIYNHKTLREEFPTWDFKSASDCEVLVPLFNRYSVGDVVGCLDAEYTLIRYGQKNSQLQAARDPIGIRPLFYGKTSIPGEIAFASEAKALSFCKTVQPFPPGFYYNNGKFVAYRSMISQHEVRNMTMEQALAGISKHLHEAVRKRIQADAPVGFLLSGGLDSSLVCAIAAEYSDKPIRTFSVGAVMDAIDNPYAEKVAQYIGANHTTVTFTQQEVMESLDELIWVLETWDITTIRASIGMYLVCKYIRVNTDVRVLLTGEVSDELFGYKYTDFAPSPEAFQNEARKRIREIYMYDVLRADRCISAHGLEARVPFGDLAFVDHAMSIPAKMKMNTCGIGKHLLRTAFKEQGLLPEDILYREKAAFSDAVGHSMVDGIKQMAEETISDKELQDAQAHYKYRSPQLKEALLYRRIFDKHFPKRATLIVDYWLPNRKWENCNVLDPSARALPNYGKSGQ